MNPQRTRHQGNIAHRLLALLLGLTLLMSMAVSSAKPTAAAAGTNTLFPNETLYAGQELRAADGSARLVMQGDGNLVRYANGRAPWSSNTAGHSGARLVMQGDGNLVVYNANNVAVFATGTAGNPGARLVMQTDANLVLYTSDYRRALWYSNSSYERAIQWFYDRRGWTSYEGYCELAVENAFGTSGVYGSALANWYDRVSKGQAHKNNLNAPRGTLVFYNTSSNGHVAISLGNGQVVSTAIGGRIGVASISYQPNPLGWAYSPW